MSQQELDAQGEAHDALDTAVTSHGRRVLSDPDSLGNLVADLLPDLPRERILLVTGAEAGIAAELTRYVEEQHLDPDTAVPLVARSLAERESIDPTASMWVTWEYARALGYQVRPDTLPSPVRQPETIPAEPPTAPAIPRPTLPTEPPTFVKTSPHVPPGPSWPPPGQSWPPGPSDRPPHRWWTGGRKRGIIATVTVAGLVVVYLIVAAAVRVVPFSPSPVPAPTPHPPTATATSTPTSTPTSAPRLAAGVAPLPQLLPTGVADPATECSTVKPPFKWSMPGLYDALTCVDPNLRGGKVTGFQLTSTASYLTAWQNFNKWWGFNPVTAAPTCPPTGNATTGSYPWRGHIFFPLQTGQVLECGKMTFGHSATPAYVYAMPTEDTFIIAQDPSFTALDNWWSTSSMPLTSPSPTSS